ncbi:MAG: AAA family ATPase [Xanthomonadales bacterium]|nr:AAA family ATPase [Xanthomonadales bacterium]
MKHFNLSERPFAITPDPRFLYMSHRHREALAHLLYGLGEGGGFVQLTGEVGTGKTTMCRCLLEKIPDNVDVALVLNPKVTSIELIATVCDELGIEYREQDASVKKLTDLLNRYLLETHARGRRTVLVIDEAQNLSTDVLEQIRLLTNLETRTQKLLQIILIGQPELRTLLQRDDMRQLAQRVTARYRLEPVTREETGAYIKHRLHVCGTTRPIFNKAAVDLIYRLSGGIPRLINVLCDRALLGAYTEDKLQIDRKIVRRAAEEVLGDEFPQPRTRPSLMLGSVVLLVLLGIAVYVYWPLTGPDQALMQATDQPVPEIPATDTAGDTPSIQTPAAQSQAALPDAAARNNAESQAGKLSEALQAANSSWSLAAWTELFARWSVRLPAAVEPDYCVFAPDMGLRCLFEHGSWGLLRQYNRPAILVLRPGSGWAVPVVLQHLDGGMAELLVGDELMRLAVGDVDRYWLGDFTMLMRSPPNGQLVLKAGDRNPDVVWLRQSLEAALQVTLPTGDPQHFDNALLNQVMDFQRNHGLTPDGVVGKQTLIQLNTYTARDVPLLSVDSS